MMTSGSIIICLINILLINNYVTADSPAVILTADEALAFGQKIKNVAVTGNVDGTAPPTELGTCSTSKPYADSMLLILGEHILEVNSVIQNTKALAIPKTDAWLNVNNPPVALDQSETKAQASVSLIDTEYKKLLDLLIQDVSNYLPGFSDQNMNADATCKYSKNEVQTDGKPGVLNNDFILSGDTIKQLIIKYNYDDDKICGRGSSSLTYFYGLYLQTLVAHLKAFIIKLFSYYSLDKYNGLVDGCRLTQKVNMQQTADSLYKAFTAGVAMTKEAFKDNIGKAQAYFRSCDGVYFEEYTTHIELDGAIQGFVYIASKQQGQFECPALSNYLVKDSNLYKPYNNQDDWSEFPKPCLGKLTDCIGLNYMAKTSDLYICLEKYGAKRFPPIVRGGGTPPTCEKNQILQRYQADKHTGCYCVCSDHDPDSRSTHVVNLQPVEADVDRNMVVTGVRFTKKRGVLNLQIQQGRLIENGEVEDIEWVPVKDISNDVYNSRTASVVHRSGKSLVEGTDFYVIKKGSTNTMNLGDAAADDGYILTGVKFRQNGNNLEISIITRPFDYRTGVVDASDARRVEKTIPQLSDRTTLTRHENDPTNWQPPLTPYVNSYRASVVFDATDVFKNFGATTVPYFDYLPVESAPPTAVAGLGSLIKMNDGFAGIISLKLKSLNYDQYINNV